MKFMVNWSIDQMTWIPMLEKWASLTPEQRQDAGEGVKILGRWHDMGSRTGVVILEATDAIAVTRYMGQWNPHMEMDIAPVLDDEDSAKAARAILESQPE